MGIVMFYQLTRSSVDEVVAMLLPRALAQGWRVMLRAADPLVLRRLDESLWLAPEGGFLPHGLEGGAQDADQPVLLGQGKAVNGARAVMLARVCWLLIRGKLRRWSGSGCCLTRATKVSCRRRGRNGRR